jgi:2-oxoglutarate ferredoxin oxidoreductase subunit delta
LIKQETLPKINQKGCKKCGICIKLCPRKVLEPGADGLPFAAHPEKCNACELCVSHCPDFAIEISPTQESGR